MQKTIAYIDGFNLYFGLKSKDWHKYYWLNIQELIQNLLKPNQQLNMTKYFTARVSRPASKRKRQQTYLEALGALDDFKMYYGRYQLNSFKCNKCRNKSWIPNEKKTDVNIAVELLADAFQDEFDLALLVSADSDLVPPVRKVRELFPEKRIVVCSPPARRSKELNKVAHGFLSIGEAKIRKSLFPFEVVKPDGYVLKCPKRWR